MRKKKSKTNTKISEQLNNQKNTDNNLTNTKTSKHLNNQKNTNNNLTNTKTSEQLNNQKHTDNNLTNAKTFEQLNNQKNTDNNLTNTKTSEQLNNQKNTDNNQFPFPPSMPDKNLYHQIISDAIKKMDPKSIEEAGCAVCGLLKPSCELSRLKSVKNLLHILQKEGITRVERKTEDQKVHEYSGPVLDYSCSKICNDCRMSLRKGKVLSLALANGLWLGKVPDELKSLRFVEKLLIARVRHTCCYVKVASGMRKMKANVIAFQSPIPKVYNILPPPCADMNEVLAILFTGPCKPTESDLSRTPFLV